MQAVIDLIKAYARIIRFVIAGGTGAVVNLTALYLLVEYAHLNPVLGSISSNYFRKRRQKGVRGAHPFC
jgi:putative flippase GtrA